MMEPITLILIIGVVGTSASSSGIQNFLIDNGHRHVDIFYNSSQRLEFLLYDVFVARLHMSGVGKAQQKSFGIFMFESRKDDLASYLSSIVQRKIKMSLLIIFGPWDKNDTNLIKKHLSDLHSSTLFYIAMPTIDSTEMTWHQIISLKSGSTINSLIFANNSCVIKETYNLHQLEVVSTSLTWAPYLTIEDCNSDGLNCARNDGFLIDYMDKLADQFNFTYVSQRNVDDDWGTIGANGTWGGVFGDVMKNNYDMSISIWNWSPYRDELLDFAHVVGPKFVMVMKPQRSNIDFGFFTRVFEVNTLAYIVFLAGVALCITFCVYQYGPEEQRDALDILTFTWWLFFTLVNSYYCGVLTMFFATPNLVPFETITDVIEAYPNWKLMVRVGSESWINEMARQGHQDFLTLQQRLRENPTETTYRSIEHALTLVEQGQNVIRTEKYTLLGHIRSNPTEHKIRILNFKEADVSLCFILHKNSPLTPMFKQGANHLMESGLERQLLYKWFGGIEQSVNAPSEGQIITLGQMITIFVVMLVVFALALIIFCGEVANKRLLKKVTTHGQGQGER